MAVFAATGAREILMILMQLWEKGECLPLGEIAWKQNFGDPPPSSYILVIHSARQHEDASGLVKDLQFDCHCHRE